MKMCVKKSFLLPVLVAGLGWLMTLPANAQFTYVTGGTITITGYTGPGGDVTIPNTINGLPVTTIGSFAFTGHTNISGVMIPDGVISIGASKAAKPTLVTLSGMATLVRLVQLANAWFERPHDPQWGHQYWGFRIR